MQLHVGILNIYLVLLPLFSAICATTCASSNLGSSTKCSDGASHAAVVIATVQNTIGAFGLSLSTCRLIANHLQTPLLSTPKCIAMGLVVGVLTAGGHARTTYEQGVWAWIEESVEVARDGAGGAEYIKQG